MSMHSNEKDTKNLTELLSKLQTLYHHKKEQLEVLHQEIEELRSILASLNALISTKSFLSADQLYSEKKKTSEDYFKEDVSQEEFKGTNVKRKIFSEDKNEEEHLICVLNFYDYQKVNIKFIDPEIRAIDETNENFMNIFLRGALIKIKETNPDLNISYDFYKDTKLIEFININNLTSIKDYDLITEKIRELLTYQLDKLT
ncbi:MAG: hypothetical protein MUP85_19950 [Candidatus Lokiarchaeota archaeon]|nr:hypothetical protein [Candidatus Lokiarchaeota archaeon]